MQAVEFDSVIRDAAIPLPASVPLAPGMAVRVVVMYEGDQPAAAAKDDAIALLCREPLVVPGFEPLSRDESHER
ncbi:hypothetical protein GRF61_16590 [Azoarcus sp. TTM-91]|uniref:hypothetical protein n=1 Tax=Azoarcus sp. TTM-91 TaxID=2691581 RepID=UPI00145D4248|nr:hypothetical protein [Azoarcus sp. TTM-91]NMG36067.1 hypothetical protein [Azoarcus sp. TTM-91]